MRRPSPSGRCRVGRSKLRLLGVALALAAMPRSVDAATCAEAGGLSAPNVTTIMVSPKNNTEAWILHPDCELEVVPVTSDVDKASMLNCTERNIQRIESLPEVERLYFDNNAVTKADFSRYTKLNHIILAWCDLKRVDGFKFPSSLNELDFEGNPIKTIPDGVIPSGVQYLYLGEAEISSLVNISLPASLSSLFLANNNFKSVNFPLPNGLENLILDGNDLKAVENFTLPDSLTSLSCVECGTTTFRGVQLTSQIQTLNFTGSTLTDFEVRQTDLELAKSAFIGNAQQSSCQDPSAQLVEISANIAACVISDDAFNTKYANRLQPYTPANPKEGDSSSSSQTPAPETNDGSSSTSSSSTVAIIIAVVSGVICIFIAAILYRKCCRGKSSCRELDDKYTDASTIQMQGSSAKTTGSGSVPMFAPHEYLGNDVRNDEALMPYRISCDEIQIIRALARGGFGVIHLGKFRGREVAVKQILPERAKEMDLIRSFMDEIRLCASLDHPKIVEFIGLSWSTLLDVAAVIEYMPGGDLKSALQAQENSQDPAEWFAASSELKAKSLLALDIIDAIVYLHSFDHPIIHRDLKSRNVLLSANGDAKLSDFGISREVVLDETMTGEIGTVAWIAPEVLQGERYSEKADIYSLGVLLVELDTARHPYRNEFFDNEPAPKTNTRIALLVSTGKLVPTTSRDCPPAIQALISQCLSFDPADRPTAMDLHYELRKIVSRLMG